MPLLFVTGIPLGLAKKSQGRDVLELQRMFLPLQKYMHVICSQSEFETLVKNLKRDDLVIIISLSGDTPAIFPVVQNFGNKRNPIYIDLQFGK